MSKTRARIAILSQMLAFPQIFAKDWKSDFDVTVQTGDLISLNCAPDSKWYVSWVIEVTYDARTGNRYLLESIEDGSLCWWGNVGVSIYNKERVWDTWKWTDDQFALNDRWNRVCKRNDAYLVRPLRPVFNEDGSVLFNVRTMHNFDESFSFPITFPKWQKVTMKQLDQYYKDAYKAFESWPRKGAA
jgi:hypothetical protein